MNSQWRYKSSKVYSECSLNLFVTFSHIQIFHPSWVTSKIYSHSRKIRGNHIKLMKSVSSWNPGQYQEGQYQTTAVPEQCKQNSPKLIMQNIMVHESHLIQLSLHWSQLNKKICSHGHKRSYHVWSQFKNYKKKNSNHDSLERQSQSCFT